MRAFVAGGGGGRIGPIPTIVLVCAIVGIVLGLGFGWARATMFSSGNPEQEYMVMVAALYDREQIISNAQERLAVLKSKDIATAVSDQAASYAEQHKEKVSTVNSLRNLAQALKNNPGTVAAPGPNATSVPGSTSAAPSAATSSSGGGISPILIIVIVVVLAAAAYVLYTKVLSKPSNRGSRKTRSMPNAEARQKAWPAHWRPFTEDDDKRPSDILSEPKPYVAEPKPYVGPAANQNAAPASVSFSPEVVSPPRSYQTGNVSEPRPYVIQSQPEVTPPIQTEAPSAYTPMPPISTPVVSPVSSQPVVSRPQPTTLPTTPAANPKTGWTIEPKSGSMAFDCHFRYDDDPYDEVHSIVDPLTKETVGACGISSAGKLPGRHGGTYSFLVWLHDYGSGEEVCCMGIVSKWAEANRTLELREWSRKERIRRVVNVVDAGRLVLETSGLRANASVVAYDYIETSSVPRMGCFRSLNLRFHVMTLA